MNPHKIHSERLIVEICPVDWPIICKLIMLELFSIKYASESSITYWTLLILFLIISLLYSCGSSLINSGKKFNIVWLLIGCYLILCKKSTRTIHFAKNDIKIII